MQLRNIEEMNETTPINKFTVKFYTILYNVQGTLLCQYSK